MTLEALIYAALGECAERTIDRTIPENTTAQYPHNSEVPAHITNAAMSPETEFAIRAWLAQIGEADPPTVARLLAQCTDDAEAQAYFLRRASVPAPEPWRLRVLAMLDSDPRRKYAVLACDPAADPVLVSVAIRDLGSFQIEIPRQFYDPFVLLQLIQEHTGERPSC